eukprot:5214281-Lingulodinium_polyedra.AAC.1
MGSRRKRGRAPAAESQRHPIRVGRGAPGQRQSPARARAVWIPAAARRSPTTSRTTSGAAFWDPALT